MPSKSPRKPSITSRSSPRTPTNATEESGPTAEVSETVQPTADAPLAPLPDSQTSTITVSETNPNPPSHNPAPSSPRQLGSPIAPTASASLDSPIATRSRQRQLSARTQSTQLQAEVAILSNGHATVEETVNQNAIHCSRHRLEDRAANDARFAAVNNSIDQIRTGLTAITGDISAIRNTLDGYDTRFARYQGSIDALRNDLDDATDRLNYHDDDIQGLLSGSTAHTEEVDRVDKYLNERIDTNRTDLQGCWSRVRELQLDLTSEQTARRTAQDSLEGLTTRLEAIEELFPPALDNSVSASSNIGSAPSSGDGSAPSSSDNSAPRSENPHPRIDKGKGKQRDNFSVDRSPSEEGIYESPGAEPHGGAGSAIWRHEGQGQPSSSTAHKRTRELTPDRRTEPVKRARVFAHPPSESSMTAVATPIPTSQPSAGMLLAPAGLSTSMLPPLPSPLSISELTSLPPLPYYATGPRHQRQEAPQPATLQAPPVDPFPHTEPDLKSGDARDRNIRMIIMKNLDGTDFFSNSDKLFNYSAFRKINIFLLARDCPALNPEPAGNGLISTTETMFVFKDASDVQSVLAAWRMRPVELHNLRIYEGGSTGHQQNTPAQSTLQEIMALDVPSSSRGRGTLRGTYRTSRGSGGGRGRGGWY